MISSNWHIFPEAALKLPKKITADENEEYFKLYIIISQ